MKPWRPGETRVFRYVHRSKPTPKGATVHGFDCHHDVHSVLVELPEDYASVDDCISLVADRCGVSRLDLESDRLARAVSRPRQLVYWLARHATTKSLPEIGRALGGRDHTTVMHGVHMMDALRSKSDHWRELSDRCLAELSGDNDTIFLASVTEP